MSGPTDINPTQFISLYLGDSIDKRLQDRHKEKDNPKNRKTAFFFFCFGKIPNGNNGKIPENCFETQKGVLRISGARKLDFFRVITCIWKTAIGQVL